MRPHSVGNVDEHQPFSHGDMLNGRYRVVHQLSQSTAATIWLCYDTNDDKLRWKSVKVLSTARSRQGRGEAILLRLAQERRTHGNLGDDHIAWPLEDFWVSGQHGRHLCIVMPFLGPSIAAQRGGDPEQIRGAFQQVAEGIKYLHDLEICHGDIRPENILFRLNNDIHNIPEERMINLLGGDQMCRDAESEAMVQQAKPDVGGLEITSEVVIVGFSNAFYASEPPKKLGIPLQFAAPELLLGRQPSYGVDTWALACALVDTRTGHSPFGTKEEDIQNVMEAWEKILGPLPQSHQRRRNQSTALEKLNGGKTEPVKAILSESHQRTVPRRLTISTSPRGETEYSNPLYAIIARDPAGQAPGTEVSNRLSRAEVVILGDLLSRVFKYDPDGRLGIHEIVEHSWFSSSFRRTSMPSPVHSETSYDVQLFEKPAGETKSDLTASSKEDSMAHKTSSSSGRWNRFGRLELLKSGPGAFFFGLVVATYFWTILITIMLKPVKFQMPFTAERDEFAQMVKSLASVVFEGTSLSGAWNQDNTRQEL